MVIGAPRVDRGATLVDVGACARCGCARFRARLNEGELCDGCYLADVAWEVEMRVRRGVSVAPWA
jgi:hypothetical protein